MAHRTDPHRVQRVRGLLILCGLLMLVLVARARWSEPRESRAGLSVLRAERRCRRDRRRELDDALQLWREKLELYLREEALVSDAGRKFELSKRIQEARRKIAGLEDPTERLRANQGADLQGAPRSLAS